MTDSTITVTAKRWTHGWELHIGSEDVTQVGSLAHADQQIRDYLDTMDPDVDHSQWTINLVPDQGYEEISQARQARREAEAAEALAAQKIRHVVHTMRHSRGYSITDTAALLGISRARVSQLEKGTDDLVA
ncbi:helix-turn-helix domain-containing protein [Enteractinococcus helveticum]|uniref:helix-turn-helix domain-containing protein n=1 Tax=Enteractinococcus helveticum TaxID=1837282 RepID=UPI0005BDD145|nr:helix-turn-helix transcriptional regulator [Enteractinococcus helveticum]